MLSSRRSPIFRQLLLSSTFGRAKMLIKPFLTALTRMSERQAEQQGCCAKFCTAFGLILPFIITCLLLMVFLLPQIIIHILMTILLTILSIICLVGLAFVHPCNHEFASNASLSVTMWSSRFTFYWWDLEEYHDKTEHPSLYGGKFTYPLALACTVYLNLIRHSCVLAVPMLIAFALTSIIYLVLLVVDCVVFIALCPVFVLPLTVVGLLMPFNVCWDGVDRLFQAILDRFMDFVRDYWNLQKPEGSSQDLEMH